MKLRQPGFYNFIKIVLVDRGGKSTVLLTMVASLTLPRPFTCVCICVITATILDSTPNNHLANDSCSHLFALSRQYSEIDQGDARNTML